MSETKLEIARERFERFERFERLYAPGISNAGMRERFMADLKELLDLAGECREEEKGKNE
jgi:hypothetical protein